MALTGLDIFKLLPKTNCKKCGVPTCLAFAMQLAQKRAKLEDCPYVSDEAKAKLAAAAAPPMRKVAFGSGDARVQVGQETVMFRHEEKFHNPTVVAVSVSDKLSGQQLNERIERINALQFERVGTRIGVKAAVVINESGRADDFVRVCEAVSKGSSLALILVTQSLEAMRAAATKLAPAKPLLAAATRGTAEAMAKIARDAGCPLAAKGESVEELAEVSEKIKAGGVEDIVLWLDAPSLREQLYGLSWMRALALKRLFRPIGYPVIAFAGVGPAEQQSAAATALACKYAGIVVVDTVEPWAILPVLTVVMNIYSDPQKPVQVEPKVYAIGEPGVDSPLMFTTNFSLTYYTVESDVEASRVSSYILVVDTEGTSVLTAYSGDKLNEKTVAEAMAKHSVDKLVRHRKIIIPGYVAVLSGKIEEATGWEVLVGPRECSMLPKYLRETWK